MSYPSMESDDDDDISECNADEGDFYELLIAGERVGEWLDTIRNRDKTKVVRLRAVRELTAAMDTKEAYAEEARQAEAATVLTKALTLTQDEELMDAISAAISVCGGALSRGSTSREFDFLGYKVRIKESSLGDGLGARMWGASYLMCKDLASAPSLLAGKRVLELGAGVGVCGLLARELGAERVVLTEALFPGVLKNLADSAAFHCEAASDLPPDTCPGEDAPYRTAKGVPCMRWHPDGRGTGTHVSPGDLRFDYGNVSVRYLDWSEEDDKVTESSLAPGLPPRLPPDEKFEVILVCDCLYEMEHATWLPLAIASRLAPHGRCHILCPVRYEDMFKAFRSNIRSRGLRVSVEVAQDSEWDRAGIRGSAEYPGGFTRLRIEWLTSPATDWDRTHMEWCTY
ncbi:hypothetical protein CYMTET_21045 [Cymbomonas tetramitiformis]|uniref:Uncharacterized protein n=1 Tax=Cymbomonas tetramitiformis TaxID=36881 RepID=A0AAE0G2T0_9CHLO|nr:hypothetical protein CYMTET_21045 [Cymbomonas tetramitiformis]